jgi:malate-CoA ligase subunit beta
VEVSLIGLEALIETALGMANVEAIATSSRRLEALHFGVADYAASCRARTVNIGGLNPDYPGDQQLRRAWRRISSRWTKPSRLRRDRYKTTDIHEYQAKELFKGFGVAIPPGGLAYSPEQAVYHSKEIGGEKWMVKAQIHSGARGKAGGIKVCKNDQEVWEAADHLLGRRLVTHQTGPRGKVVNRLYIEAATEIEREIYLGLVLDRQSERVMVVASAEGGMEIEEIAVKRPQSILRQSVEPAVGMQEFQAREIAFSLKLPPALLSQAVTTFTGAYWAFRDLDATMVEINPLVVTKDGRFLALDAKMAFDDNALFRRSMISELRDKSQEDPREMAAADRA